MIKEVKVLICDKCKKEVERFETSFKVTFPVRDILGNIAAGDKRDVDLCYGCAEKLQKFLDNKEPYNF